MSKIQNDGLDQYGAEPFEQQQFGTAGVEGVRLMRVKLQNTAVKQMSEKSIFETMMQFEYQNCTNIADTERKNNSWLLGAL